MKNLLQVWFNPEKLYFEVFDNYGRPIPSLMATTLKDNWKSGSAFRLTVTFEAPCNLVSEKPIPEENIVLENNN